MLLEAFIKTGKPEAQFFLKIITWYQDAISSYKETLSAHARTHPHQDLADRNLKPFGA
jgi:hypothetical protein